MTPLQAASLLLAAFAAIALPLHNAYAMKEKPLRWYGYGYGGVMIEEAFLNAPRKMHSLRFLNARLAALGGGRELYHHKDYFTIEAEGQIAKHLGSADHHWELNALANIRWQKFPWDRWLNTSVAWGHGLSYATEKAQVERDDFGGDTSHILYYMSLEADVILPKQADWSVFARIHHRSGVFGVINNVDGGVNAFALGVKKRF